MHPDNPSERTPRGTARRRLSTFTRVAAVSALALSAIGLAAAPSSANGIGGTVSSFSVGNGIVGVPQVVSYSITSIASQGALITAQGSASAQPVTVANLPSVTVPFTSSFAWTPPHVGTWTFSVNGSPGTGSTFINQVGTTISVTAPNTVQVGVPTNITATVSAQSGSVLAPLGSVQFAIVGGGNVGAPVWLNGANPSTATIPWTPATLGTVAFTATYIPNVVNGTADTTCGTSCTSAPDSIQVTASGSSFFLSNPGTLTAGSSARLQAVVGVVPPTGSVTFFVNGAAIAVNVPVNAQGIAGTYWTPPAVGTFTLTASWIANNGVTGTASENLVVVSGPSQQDGIALNQVGVGVWNPAGQYPLANGTTASFTIATSSGATGTLSEVGPCTLAGNVLSAPQGNGQCRLTASSPGGNGYGANAVVYTVNLIPGTQTAVLAAPPSGRVNVGRNIRLETAAQGDTNAGQNITWRITTGRNSVCSLSFPTSGAVNLRIRARGKCVVQGRAPGVAGQWNAFSTSRTYRGV